MPASANSSRNQGVRHQCHACAVTVLMPSAHRARCHPDPQDEGRNPQSCQAALKSAQVSLPVHVEEDVGCETSSDPFESYARGAEAAIDGPLGPSRIDPLAAEKIHGPIGEQFRRAQDGHPQRARPPADASVSPDQLSRTRVQSRPLLARRRSVQLRGSSEDIVTRGSIPDDRVRLHDGRQEPQFDARAGRDLRLTIQTC